MVGFISERVAGFILECMAGFIGIRNKDDSWSFDHFDTITVSIPDAPRPDEIVVVMALADGGRLHPRCGDNPR